MKKLKYLFLITLITFIFVSPVNAVTGNPNTNGTIFLTPYAGDFADNTNGQLTRTGSYFSNDYKGFASNSQITLNGSNTYGANLIFDALQPFVAGYTYALSVLISLGPGVPLDVYPKASSTRVCIAETGNNAVTRYNNPSQFPCTNAYVTNTIGSPGWWNVTDGTNDLRQYGLLTYVFTADFTATSITLSYNSSQPITSYHAFGGYVVEILSDNKNISQDEIKQAVQSSGLATANSLSEVQQSVNSMYQDLGKHAQNIIDANRYDSQQIQGAIEDTNDTLKDETAPNLDLSDLEVSSNTPISDLITMPLTILNTLIQTLGGSCTNYTIPFFYNSSLTFPCFTISDYLGSTVTNYIDLFICFYMCYNIAMLVISVFEDVTSLRDIYDSMYVPKHAESGYQPKHAKGGGN